MYQFIVLCLGFLLLFGGGYLIKKTDRNSVITGSLSYGNSKSANSASLTLPTSEEMAGTFLCDSDSGCTDNVSINLVQTGDVYMTTSYKDGTPALSEKGRWMFEQGGLISLKLTESDSSQYNVPHMLLIQSVSTTTLDKFSYDAVLYKDMKKPTFSRPGSN